MLRPVLLATFLFFPSIYLPPCSLLSYILSSSSPSLAMALASGDEQSQYSLVKQGSLCNSNTPKHPDFCPHNTPLQAQSEAVGYSQNTNGATCLDAFNFPQVEASCLQSTGVIDQENQCMSNQSTEKPSWHLQW
ncbi:unnamed protein product [Protopolystoma xenopodis]|uniref:Uncharacterized protein n=1 Tax=Protopolystoma xenopodis TaxID=117903 RepID=A0A3S5BTC5_9PLAT|nr:unnamed protein product [Protopolystoma xenopodis]